MPHATWIRDRRGALAGASAVLVCLGGALASCGTGTGAGGYTAVGPGDASPRPTVAPTGDVRFVPLDDTRPSADSTGSPRPGTADPSGPSGSPGGRGGPETNGPGSTPPDEAGRTTPKGPSPAAPAPSPSSGGGTSAPSPDGPAELSAGTPEREPTDRRWCEKVTVEFHNTGGTPVRSGTVTFGTHVIGPLGVDWATVESTEELPAPIGPGERRERTWTVCVDEWRVPLGMHIETRDVSVEWE